jgi:hypothetical protein
MEGASYITRTTLLRRVVANTLLRSVAKGYLPETTVK